MKKKLVRELLKKAYKAGQESVKAMKLYDRGHLRYGVEDSRMEDTIDNLMIESDNPTHTPEK